MEGRTHSSRKRSVKLRHNRYKRNINTLSKNKNKKGGEVGDITKYINITFDDIREDPVLFANGVLVNNEEYINETSQSVENSKQNPSTSKDEMSKIISNPNFFNVYEVLNMNKDRTSSLSKEDKKEVINKVYKELAKIYHPDRLGSQELKDKCNTDNCIKTITNARDILTYSLDFDVPKVVEPTQQPPVETEQNVEPQKKSGFFSNLKNKTVKAFSSAAKKAASSVKNKTVKIFSKAKDKLSDASSVISKKAAKAASYIKDNSLSSKYLFTVLANPANVHRILFKHAHFIDMIKFDEIEQLYCGHREYVNCLKLHKGHLYSSSEEGKKNIDKEDQKALEIEDKKEEEELGDAKNEDEAVKALTDVILDEVEKEDDVVDDADLDDIDVNDATLSPKEDRDLILPPNIEPSFPIGGANIIKSVKEGINDNFRLTFSRLNDALLTDDKTKTQESTKKEYIHFKDEFLQVYRFFYTYKYQVQRTLWSFGWNKWTHLVKKFIEFISKNETLTAVFREELYGTFKLLDLFVKEKKPKQNPFETVENKYNTETDEEIETEAENANKAGEAKSEEMEKEEEKEQGEGKEQKKSSILGSLKDGVMNVGDKISSGVLGDSYRIVRKLLNYYDINAGKSYDILKSTGVLTKNYPKFMEMESKIACLIALDNLKNNKNEVIELANVKLDSVEVEGKKIDISSLYDASQYEANVKILYAIKLEDLIKQLVDLKKVLDAVIGGRTNNRRLSSSLKLYRKHGKKGSKSKTERHRRSVVDIEGGARSFFFKNLDNIFKQCNYNMVDRQFKDLEVMMNQSIPESYMDKDGKIVDPSYKEYLEQPDTEIHNYGVVKHTRVNIKDPSKYFTVMLGRFFAEIVRCTSMAGFTLCLTVGNYAMMLVGGPINPSTPHCYISNFMFLYMYYKFHILGGIKDIMNEVSGTGNTVPSLESTQTPSSTPNINSVSGTNKNGTGIDNDESFDLMNPIDNDESEVNTYTNMSNNKNTSVNGNTLSENNISNQSDFNNANNVIYQYADSFSKGLPFSENTKILKDKIKELFEQLDITMSIINNEGYKPPIVGSEVTETPSTSTSTETTTTASTGVNTDEFLKEVDKEKSTLELLIEKHMETLNENEKKMAQMLEIIILFIQIKLAEYDSKPNPVNDSENVKAQFYEQHPETKNLSEEDMKKLVDKIVEILGGQDNMNKRLDDIERILQTSQGRPRVVSMDETEEPAKENEELKEKDNQIKELQTQIDDSNKKIQSNEAEMNSLREQIANLKAEKEITEDNQAKIDELNAKLALLEQENKDLLSKIEDFKSKLSELEQKVGLLDQENKSILEEKDEETRQKELVIDQFNGAKETIDKLKKQIEDNTIKIEENEKLIDDMKQEKDKDESVKSEEINGLKKENQDLKSQNETLNGNLSNLSDKVKELEAVNDKNSELTSKLDALSVEGGKNEEEISKLKEQLLKNAEEYKSGLDSMAKENQTVVEQLSKTSKEELDKKQVELDEKQKEIEELNRKLLEKTETERQTEEERIKQEQEELEKIRRDKEYVEKEMDNLRKELSAFDLQSKKNKEQMELLEKITGEKLNVSIQYYEDVVQNKIEFVKNLTTNYNVEGDKDKKFNNINDQVKAILKESIGGEKCDSEDGCDTSIRKIMLDISKAYNLYKTDTIIKLISLLSDKDMFTELMGKIGINKTVDIEGFVDLFFIDISILKSKFPKIFNYSKTFKITDEQIERDTKIRNKYISEGSGEYIFLYTLVAYIKNIIFSSKGGIDRFFANSDTSQTLEYIFKQSLSKVYKLFKQYSSGNLSSQTNVISSVFDEYVEKTKRVFTFIKQRQNTETGNKRYDIKLTSLEGGKTFDPTEETDTEYDKNDKILKLVYVNNDTKNKIDKTTKKETFDSTNKETYYFGPFDKYYDYHYSNKKIANDLSLSGGLLDKTISEDGKDMCIIGYGQSGSGKTSTLIYSNYKDNEGKEVVQDGVLIELCKNPKFIEKYKKIGLRAINLYLKETDDSIRSKEDMSIDNDKYVYEDLTSNDSYEFIYSVTDTGSGLWKRKGFFQSGGDEDVEEEELDDYGMGDGQTRKCEKKQKFTVKNGTLGEYILDIFQKRQIEPTPNNPDSSRSHLIVCLDLYKQGETVPSRRVTVCDLAGVENEFNCDDTVEIAKFISNYGKSEKYSCEDMDGCMMSPENIYKYIRNITFKNSLDQNISDIKAQIQKQTTNNFEYTAEDVSNFNLFVDKFITPLNKKSQDDVNRIFDLLTYMYYHSEVIKPNKKTFYFTDDVEPSVLNIPNSKSKIYEDIRKDIPDRLTKDINELNKLSKGKTIDVINSVKKIVSEEDLMHIRFFEYNKYMRRQTVPDRLVSEIKRELFYKRKTPEDINNEKSEGLKNLKCTLMLLEKIRTNCVIRRREGYMINRSLSDLRDGIQGFIKQSVQDKDGNMPLFYEKSIYPYCRNINITDKYFDYFYKKPENNNMTSALTSIMGKSKIPNSNVKPFGLDLANTNFAIFTVINTNNDGYTNNPPNPPFININDLIYFTEIAETDPVNLSRYYLETIEQALKYNFYKNGILDKFIIPVLSDETLKNHERYIDDYVLNSENAEDISEPLPLSTLIDKSRSLIRLIKGNNASTLVGSLESTDVLQNTVYSKMVCAETNDKVRNDLLNIFRKKGD